MHSADPYTVIRPRPCLVATRTGVHHGLVVGLHGRDQLVVHGRDGYDQVSWAPSEEATVLGASDWAPWSAGLAANA